MPGIFISNSRKIQAHMIQMRYSIEHMVAIVFDEINLSDIQDALSGMLFSSKGSKEYKKPIEILQRLADE